MKQQLVQNTRRRSLVVSATKPRESALNKGEIALRDSLSGWLDSATPPLLHVLTTPPLLHVLTWKGKTPLSLNARKALSSVDQIRVDRATVRESHSHRHWPPDVVLKFSAAEVITRRSGD